MKNPPVITSEYARKLKDGNILIFENEVGCIEKDAFSGNMNIEKIIFEKSVDSIQPWSFFNCRNLTDLIFKDEVSTIGFKAFENCVSLNNLEYTKIKTILNDAFVNCALDILDISKISYIEENAFCANNFNKLQITTPCYIAECAFAYNNVKDVFVNTDSDKFFYRFNKILKNNHCEIENFYFSAPEFNFNNFAGLNIKNLFIDAQKLSSFIVTIYNPDEIAKIKNVYLEEPRFLKTAKDISSYKHFCYDMFKKSIIQDSLDEVIKQQIGNNSYHLTLEQINKLVKSNNGHIR